MLASCKKTDTGTQQEAKRSKQDNAYKNIEKSLMRPGGGSPTLLSRVTSGTFSQ